MGEPEHTSKHAPKADPPRQRPPSPPASPVSTVRQRDFVRLQSGLSHTIDPVVYPQDHDENAAPQHSSDLFPHIGDSAQEIAIKEHHKKIAVHYMRGKSKGDRRTLRYIPPTIDEYRLACEFVSRLSKQDPTEYIRRICAQNRQLFPLTKRPLAPPALPHIAAKPAHSIPSPLTQPNKARVVKSPLPRKLTTPRVTAVSSGGATPRSGRAATPHTRVQREPKRPTNDNWRLVEDMCPSTAILDERPKALEISWEGKGMDLSSDPNRDELHRAEIALASALRLPCARYLTCKRKIFVGRVEALRKGKEFKKTDAQQCCQIDVNKASKLWMAFDKAGWFQSKLFKEYLN